MTDTEVRSLLHRAASSPHQEVDLPTIERRGRQLRRSRLVTTASAVVAAVIVLAVGTALVVDTGSDPTVQTPATRPESKTYVDKRNGMSVRIPLGWRRTVPPPTTGLQRLTVQTTAKTTRCDGSRIHSAQISVMEIPSQLAVTPTPIRRPTVFGPDSGQTQEGTTGQNGCFAATGIAPGQAISFTDKDRVFQVFITLYPGVGADRRQAQAYAILDSLRFTADAELEREPLAVPGGGRADLPTILVLNGSGTPGVAATTANNLRVRGYPIAGTGNAPAISSGTLVQCRGSVESAAASRLAGELVPMATVGAFPEPPPDGAESADCIVTVGS